MQIFVKNPKDSQELCLIEMQGDLESRLGSNVDVSGKFIGDLHYTKDGKTKFTAKANFSQKPTRKFVFKSWFLRKIWLYMN